MLRRYGWPAAVVRKLAAARRAAPRRRRPVLGWEPLEDRTTPATYTVTNTANAGAGSLRQAILDANATAAADTIAFNISGTGVHTITPTTPLPSIVERVTIDGTTESDYAGVPRIALSGGTAGTSGYGLQVAGVDAASSVIRGLAIYGWTFDANVRIASDNVGVYSCYIGIDAAANAGASDTTGIRVDVGSNVRIGDTEGGWGNVIADTGNYGILISSGADNVLVQGNRIGVHPTNDTALGVQPSRGISINGSINNTIGGAAAGAGNLIDNYNQYGVEIIGAGASGSVVAGNVIGAVAGGGVAGVQINSAPNNTVGGTAPGAGNVISDNTFGVAIQFSGADNNQVLGNWFGTDASKNPKAGLQNATGVIVGNTATGAVVGQPGAGNHVFNSTSNGIIVNANINTVAANEVRGSGLSGITVTGSSNTVGGTTPLTGNLVTGGLNYGIRLSGSGATGNLVAGNLVGVEASGAAAGTGGDGILVDGGASNNLIGGSADAGQQVLGLGAAAGQVDDVALAADGTYLFINRFGALSRLNPATGAVTTVATGTRQFRRVAVSPADGTVYVSQVNGVGYDDLYRVGAGGALTYIPGGSYRYIDGLAVTASGQVLIASQFNGPGAPERVYRVDPATGTATVVAEGGSLDRIADVAVEADGKYVTLGYSGQIVRIDPDLPLATNQTVVYSSGTAGHPFSTPRSVGTSLVVGPDGSLYATGSDGGGDLGGVYRFDPASGTFPPTPITAGFAVNYANGLAVLPGGDFLVADGSYGLVRVTANAARNVVGNSGAAGVRIDGSGTNATTVAGNYIGTSPSGRAAAPNAVGVQVAGGATNAVVGGTGPVERNVISGNAGPGVWVLTPDVVVAGNYIGTDAAGAAAVPNADGVVVEVTDRAVVGGPTAGNLISGNVGAGVLVLDTVGGGGADDAVIQGNRIGTDATGTSILPNRYGVRLFGAVTNTVVGTDGDGVLDADERNVISGNTLYGVVIEGSDATANRVAGNLIGTAADGTAGPGNEVGVGIVGAKNNTVGGTGPDDGNVISGNNTDGVRIFGAFAQGNVVAGNLIGTRPDGLAAVPNGVYGVRVFGAASGNAVGGAGGFGQRLASELNNSGAIVAEPGGTVLVTDYHALTRYNPSTGATVTAILLSGLDRFDALAVSATGAVYAIVRGDAGNRLVRADFDIGTVSTVSDTGVFSGFGASGVAVDAGGFVIVSSTAGGGQVVRVNPDTGDQVVVTSGGQFLNGQAPEAVAVDPADGSYLTLSARGKIVRVLTDGTQLLVRAAGGVFASPVAATSLTPLFGGVILVTATTATGSAGGVYGVDPATGNTTAYVTGGHVNQSGGLVRQAGGNWLVASASGIVRVVGNAAMNVISGNAASGVYLHDAGTTGNTVDGNLIGLNLDGTAAVPNGNEGVEIDQGAAGNVIGSLAASGAVNVISGNGRRGVLILGTGTNNTVIAGARIGTNAAGTAAVPNQIGVEIGGGAAGTVVGINGDGVNDTAEGNLISGNTEYGVVIDGANNTRVAGNLIGTDALGVAAVPNTDGVAVFSGTGNVVGTDGSNDSFNSLELNLISGNTGRGVILDGPNVVAGNIIGLDSNGNLLLGQQYGVQVTGAGGRVGTNADGVADAAERNVISGHALDGIIVRNVGTTGAVIAGNYIGTDLDGLTARPNGANGISITLGAAGNTVGGTTAAARNVIGGNAQHGLIVTDAGTDGNTIRGNFIGLGANGSTAVGNGGEGVKVTGGAANTAVGGVAAGAAETVARSNFNTFGRLAVGPNGQIVNLYAGGPATYVEVRNPTTGAVLQSYSGGVIESPQDVAVGPDGSVYVYDTGPSYPSGAVIRIDPATGTPAVLQSAVDNVNTPANQAAGRIAVDPASGDVVVLVPYYGAVFRVDRATGVSSVVSLGGILGTGSDGLAVAGGTAFVGNGFFGGANPGNVVGIDLATGNPRVVFNPAPGDGVITFLVGLAADSSGRLYLLENRNDTPLGRFDPAAGTFTRLPLGTFGVTAFSPAGVAVSPNRDVFVADGGTNMPPAPTIPSAVLRLAANAARNVIGGNTGRGVWLDGAGAGSVVTGNFIGTDPTGTVSQGNLLGVAVTGTADALVGGAAEGAGNLISNNANANVFVHTAPRAAVRGNLIGTTPDGLAAAPFATSKAVLVDSSTGATIGGGNPGEGNVIGGYTVAGVSVYGEAFITGVTVAGNLVGLNRTGTAAIGGGALADGIVVDGTTGTVVGGSAGFGNYVAGNGVGIRVRSSVATAQSVQVLGNRVGTDLAGAPGSLLGNSAAGILVNNGPVGTRVGSAAAGNVVAVSVVGILVFASETTVAGNLATDNATGIRVYGSNNLIGGPAYADGNRAYRSGLDGVHLTGGASNNVVSHNSLGTGYTLAAAGQGSNSRDGLRVDNGANNNTIASNVVGANFGNGITLEGGGTTGNVLSDNLIGLDTTGGGIFNIGNGVAIVGGAAANTLRGNTVSNSLENGVFISGDGTDRNVVRGNKIGTNVEGTDGGTNLGLSNDIGVYVAFGAAGNVIGGTFAADRNIISGNTVAGVRVYGAGTADNLVSGNYIGTTVSGASPLANDVGVRVDGVAADTVVGAPAAAGAVSWLVAEYTAGSVRQLAGPRGADLGRPVAGAAGAYDAEYGPDGNLYVAARNGGVLRYDGTTGAFLGTFVANGAGGMTDPISLLFTPDGELLVGARTAGGEGILRFNAATGAYLGTLINQGALALALGADGALYATHYFGFLFKVDRQTGAEVWRETLPGGGIPDGLSVGPDGRLYVAGYQGNRVLRVDPTTRAVTTLISGGQLSGPTDARFGPDGNLYVANYTDGSVARYTAAGSFLDYYAAPGTMSAPARLLAARGGGNVISDNAGNGVLVNGAGTAGTVIAGNIIGLDPAGFGVQSNGGDGIEVSSAGTTTIRGNTVASNVGANVSLGGNGALAGTASWWPGEGSPIDVVGPNHLSQINGAGYAAADATSQALSFDGVDDYFRADYDPTLNPVNAVSVEAWVKPATMPAAWADVVNQFFDGSTFGAGSYSLRLYADGSVGFLVGTSVVSPDLYWAVRSAPGLVTAGTFAHVAGTYDAATGALAVYVNGVRALGTGTGTLDNSHIDLKIGADLFNGRYFHGLIDEPAIYTRALSIAEVQTIHRLNRVAKGGHTVVGNRIGTDAAGAVGIGGGSGVEVVDSAGNAVGGYGAADANVISGHGGDGVTLSGDGAVGNVVRGNFIGTDASGTGAIGNRSGVSVSGGASGNTIGGGTSGAGNFISGNRESGVVVGGLFTDGNAVLGNLIGTDVTGRLALGNDGDGVRVEYGATNTVVGGAAAGAGNVIAANGGSGVFVAADGTAVRGNFVGTDRGRTEALGNAGDGVSIEAADVTVGGVGVGEGNAIAHNLGAGVVVVDLGPTFAGGPRGGNAVRGNTIYQNVGLGIDLGGEDGPDGFTPNDPGDADVGPNARVNFPVLTGASIVAGQLVVSGIARPGAVLDLYAADLTRYGPDADDPNPFGQGRTYLGAVTVPAGAAAGYGPKAVNGTYLGADAATAFSLALPLPAGFAPGTPVVATATTPEGTSEFGNNATAQVPTLTATLDPPAIDEGATAVLRGAFPTVDPAHAHTVRVDWGDGSVETRPVTPGSAAFELPHTYRDNPAGSPVGAFPVLVTVTDTETGFAQTTATAVTVANVAPRVRVVSAPGTNATGATVVLAAEVTDPGADAFTYAWVVTQNGTVVGSAAGPTLTFTRDPSLPSVVTLTVADDDGGFGADTATVFSLTQNSDTKQVTPADVLPGADRAVVLALGGNDVVTVRDDVTVPVVVDGGDGNDAITGGPGNDVLTGGMGNDSIDGGGGDDFIEQAPGSSDTLAGGGGNDTLSFKTAAQGTNGLGVTFSLASTDRQAVLTTGTGTHYLQASGIENLIGSAFADDLTGDEGDNEIYGGVGRDTIRGGGGDDVIFGGTGAGNDTAGAGGLGDVIYGGVGSDTIRGGAGDDVIFGGTGAGNDTAATGNDVIFGGVGRDTITGGAGDDVIFGGTGAGNDTAGAGGLGDVIYGGVGSDTIRGGAGDDVIFGGTGAGNDTAATGNDVIFGGVGSDTIRGGGGDDVIFGGTGAGNDTATTGNDVIFGGLGRDTITGGVGNDVIFGGTGAGNDTAGGSGLGDVIYGGVGRDTIAGGAGDDVIYGGTGANNDTAGAGGLGDVIYGGVGRDTIRGGGGDDVIFGDITYFLTDFGNLASGSTLTAGAGDDVIYGGVGSDTIRAGGGDDVIFGGTGAGNDTATAGNDVIYGGVGSDTIRTGGGNDVIYGEEDVDAVEVTAAASLSISGTPQDASITGGGMVKLLYNVEHFGLTGGAGNDTLSAAGFAAPVSLSGGAGDDSLVGGTGDDTLDGGAGADTLAGGAGADTYAFAGGQLGSDTITEAAANHGDELNFNGFPAPITLDLGKTTPQVVSPGNLTLTLSSETAIEDVWGTAYGDVVTGNARDNVLIGGGGLDSLDGAAGDDTVQGGVTQWVLIDFDTHTGGRDHVYTGDERAAILVRLADAFAAFRYAFTTDPAGVPPGTPFVTVSVNKPPEVDGVSAAAVGGRASELDWRNTDLAGGIDIDANFLLAAPKANTSANFVALTAAIIGHEVGHISGLRHADSFGPIGSGVFPAAPLGRVLPPYPGPAGANETRRDLMASPASVGISLADSLGPVAFGARDAIKLAFADTGTTAAETVAAHDSPAAAQPLALAPLAVPNTLLPPVLNDDGTVAVPSRDYGKHFAVTATSVAGRIARTDRGAGPSEKDYYSFAGTAGQLVTLEAISQGLGGTRDRVDTVLRLLGPGGQELYYPNGQPVMNDDWLEPTDATILDYTLPATGTYTVVVESYGAEEAGDYELFVYTFATGDDPAPGGGDTLAAGGGADELVGSSGADTFKVAGAGAVKVTTPANNGRATLDLSGLPAGVTIDLGSTEPQQLGRLVLTLGSAAAVRGFVGTPFADHVTGNQLDNTFAAAGDDTFASGGGRDTVTATAAGPGTITATDGLLAGPGFTAHLGEGVTRAKLFGSAGEDAFVVTGWTGTAALDGGGAKDTYLVNLSGDEGEVALHDSGPDDPREVKDALTVKGAKRVVNQVPVGVDEDFVLEAGSVRVSDERVLYDATIESVEIDGNGGADAAVPGRTPSGPVKTTDIDPALSLGRAEDYLTEGGTFSRAGIVTLPDAKSVSVLYGLGPNEVPQVITLTGAGTAKSFLLSQVYANNKTDNSPYQVRVTVLDKNGQPLNDPTQPGDPGRVDVYVLNDAPRLTQPNNATAKLRVGAAFDLGTLADPGDDGPWTVAVNWGDGSPVVPFTVSAPGPLTASHSFTTRPAFGIAVVSVTVTEGKAPFASVRREFYVTVRAEDVISGTGAAVEGRPFALALPNLTQRAGDDPLAGITRFRVNWNDGTPEQEFAGAPAGQTLLHAFAADGPLALGVRVSVEFADAPGFFLPAGTMQVAVADAPPAVELLGGGTAVEGGTYTLSFGAITDPGADTITTFTIHWGDGVRQVVQGRPGGPNNLSRTHVYPDNGAYTITVDATDEDGTHAGVGSKRVDVSDVAPTVALSAAGRVQAGTPLALGLGPVTDPGVVDRVTGYTIDWGHGAPEAFTGSPAGATRSHTYPAPGTFTIRVGLTNKDGTFTPAGTETVVVDPAGVATRLAFVVQPSAVGVTEAIAPGVAVRVETAGGSLLTGSSATVTLALGANPGNATLGPPGAVTAAAVNGVATFAGLTVSSVGDGYTLRATSGALTAATSDPFNVLPPTQPGVRVVTNNGATEVYVVGTAGADMVMVLPGVGGKVVIQYSLDGSPTIASQQVPAPAVLRVYLGEGTNTFTMAAGLTVPATVLAGDGNNTITTGGGNDLVVAGNGRNTIDGGPGNDLLIGGRYAPPAGDAGRTVLTGGTGNDLLVAGSAVLKAAGDSFRKLADDWARLGPTAAGLANVRTRLTATYAAGRYRLTGDAGVDWFWFNPAAPAGAIETDRLTSEPLR